MMKNTPETFRTAEEKSVYHRYENILEEFRTHWKAAAAADAKSFRFRVIAIVLLLVGAAASVTLGILFGFSGAKEIICNLIPAAAGLIAAIILGVIACGASKEYHRELEALHTSNVERMEALEIYERAKMEPLLDNQVVICGRVIKGQASSTAKGKKGSTGKTKISKENGNGIDGSEVRIDGIPVGALSNSKEFSCFHAGPGQHVVRVKIEKNLRVDGKRVRETFSMPVKQIWLNGNYRILCYTIRLKPDGSTYRYSVGLSEYNDVITFLRDTYGIRSLLPGKEYRNEWSRYEIRLADKLEAMLAEDERVAAEERRSAREKAIRRHGREKILLDELAERIDSGRFDA